MTRPGAPRWFERLPSHAWTLAAAFLAPVSWLVGDYEPDDLGDD